MLGWLSLVVIYQLYIHLDGTGLLLLGLEWSHLQPGVIFYVAKRIPYNHAIWHLFCAGWQSLPLHGHLWLHLMANP